MLPFRTSRVPPLPPGFLEWQVRLRAHTVDERHGTPHAGVAPLLLVHNGALAPGFAAHSIICGLLPRPNELEAKTADFRRLYEEHIRDGARQVYDRSLIYLKYYYSSPLDFDPASLSTLMRGDRPAIKALRAEPRCALLFYVFDLEDKSELGRFRCLQVNCRAEVLTAGPVFDNVWWHNTLFHGKAEDCVVVHFRHEGTFDTRFGGLEEV